jgi:hypothetical protein
MALTYNVIDPDGHVTIRVRRHRHAVQPATAWRRPIRLHNSPVRPGSRTCSPTATVCSTSSGGASATRLAPAVNVAAKSSSN